MKKYHAQNYMGKDVMFVTVDLGRDLRFITNIIQTMGHRQPYIQIKTTMNTSTRKLERIQNSFY